MTEQTFVAGIITGGITAALVGIVPALIVVLVLVTLDLLTGIWAALSNDIKIESHKLRQTAYKLLAYLSVITLAAMIDGAITAFSWNLGSFVAGFIMIVELTSLVENFGHITHHDVFEKLRDALGRHREKKYGKDVSKSETTENHEMDSLRHPDSINRASDSIRNSSYQERKDN